MKNNTLASSVRLKFGFLSALIVLLGGGAGLSNAYASCSNEDNTVFACNLMNKKQVSVCKDKGAITYAYGTPNKDPDISLRLLPEIVGAYSWTGTGDPNKYDSVDLLEGARGYSVFWSASNGSANQDIDAGLHLISDHKIHTTIRCQRTGIVNNIKSSKLSPLKLATGQ